MRSHSRSSFDSLSNGDRVKVRQAAMARMGAGALMVTPDQARIPATRAGHEGEPGHPAGTYNGGATGTSSGDGVELLSNVIHNQVTARTGQRANSNPSPTMPKPGGRKPMVQASDARHGGRMPMVQMHQARHGGRRPMVTPADAGW